MADLDFDWLKPDKALIDAEVIADSINGCNNRLTTFKLTYPRFIHSELMTHRAFSRNAASSRAVPVDKMLARIAENPARPIVWASNQPGMKSGSPIDRSLWSEAEKVWLEGLQYALETARKLQSLGLHKSIVNRVVEPWLTYQVVVTATEWKGWFAQRNHPEAQPEIHALAAVMREKYQESIPVLRDRNCSLDGVLDWWHLPFVDDGLRYDSGYSIHHLKLISTARCARVSYFLHDGVTTDPQKDIELANKLIDSNPGHWSPLEHPAIALDKPERSGNFVGWMQYRKEFVNESNGDYSSALNSNSLPKRYEVKEYQYNEVLATTETPEPSNQLKESIRVVEFVRLGGGSGIPPVGICIVVGDSLVVKNDALLKQIANVLKENSYYVKKEIDNSLRICRIEYNHKYFFGWRIFTDKEGTRKKADAEEVKKLIESCLHCPVSISSTGYLSD